MSQRYDHAIVAGASVAGLWTARVLADHFRQVTVLERDRLPEGAASRPGVPQDRHVHVLLQRGALIMGRLFPGIEDELTARGASCIDLTQDSRAKLSGRWAARFPSGKITYACSRILLESVVRRRVAGLPNVTIRGAVQVQGLVADNGRVSGVRVGWKDGGETVERGDFVVDATGRTSRAHEWLAELGYAAPEETVIDVRLGYSARRYRRPADIAVDWSIMLLGQDHPRQSRGGLIYSEEDGVWMVMVAGILGDYPPVDEDGFRAFAAGLDPAFHSAIRDAEPVGAIFGYRRSENRLRHYDKLARWPERFVVLGDAVCAFNPIYGQGMTVAAMAAEDLGRRLARAGGLDGLARAFQAGYARLVNPAWLLATSADLQWLEPRKERSAFERFASWYLSQVLAAVPDDRRIHEVFLEVQNLMQPPSALFHPAIALRAFRRRVKPN